MYHSTRAHEERTPKIKIKKELKRWKLKVYLNKDKETQNFTRVKLFSV